MEGIGLITDVGVGVGVRRLQVLPVLIPSSRLTDPNFHPEDHSLPDPYWTVMVNN